MWLRVGCRLTLQFDVASPMLTVLRPHSGAQQWVAADTFHVSPRIPIRQYTDALGNLCQRLLAPKGPMLIQVSSDIQVPPFMDQAPGAPFVSVESLPDNAIMYLMPSRFCESDRLGSLAAQITADIALGYDQVACISDWIRHHLHYRINSQPDLLSASEVLDRGEGVCRDLAHVGIALCRSLSIPARMVVGYVPDLDPMDHHAWFEAFVGDRWYCFDPTWPRFATGRVALAYGRDAADVPVFSIFGPPVMPFIEAFADYCD
jgi:transglutaminase-like putative cysteine protease